MSAGVGGRRNGGRGSAYGGAGRAPEGGGPTSEALLVDPGYVRLVRWVFTARLVCLALATPARPDRRHLRTGGHPLLPADDFQLGVQP